MSEIIPELPPKQEPMISSKKSTEERISIEEEMSSGPDPTGKYHFFADIFAGKVQRIQNKSMKVSSQEDFKKKLRYIIGPVNKSKTLCMYLYDEEWIDLPLDSDEEDEWDGLPDDEPVRLKIVVPARRKVLHRVQLNVYSKGSNVRQDENAETLSKLEKVEIFDLKEFENFILDTFKFAAFELQYYDDDEWIDLPLDDYEDEWLDVVPFTADMRVIERALEDEVARVVEKEFHLPKINFEEADKYIHGRDNENEVGRDSKHVEEKEKDWRVEYSKLSKDDKVLLEQIWKYCKDGKSRKLRKIFEVNFEKCSTLMNFKFMGISPLFAACVQSKSRPKIVSYLLSLVDDRGDMLIDVNSSIHRRNGIPIIFHIVNYISELSKMRKVMKLTPRMNLKRKNRLSRMYHTARLLYETGLDENSYVRCEKGLFMNVLMYAICVDFPFTTVDFEEGKLKREGIFDRVENIFRALRDGAKKQQSSASPGISGISGLVDSGSEVEIRSKLLTKLCDYATVHEHLDLHGNSVLHYAVHHNNRYLMYRLAGRGDEYKEKGISGDKGVVAKIDDEPLIVHSNNFGDTCLIECARTLSERDVDVFDMIVQMTRKEDPALLNSQNVNGDTALHYCCRYGKYEFVKRMLETLGCSMFLKNMRGFAPLDEIKNFVQIYDLEKVEKNGEQLEKSSDGTELKSMSSRKYREKFMEGRRMSKRQERKIADIVNVFAGTEFDNVRITEKDKKKYKKILEVHREVSERDKIQAEMKVKAKNIKDVFNMVKYNPFQMSLIDTSSPNVKLIGPIGEGGESTVYEYEVNDQKLAFIRLKESYKDIARKLQEDLVLKQFLIQLKVNHCNVIGFKYFCVSPLGFFQEFCDEEVAARIKHCERNRTLEKLSAKETVDVLEQTVRGMAYLHSDERHKKPIVHSDLKWENVMLRRSEVKIIDFGMAREVRQRKKDDKRKRSVKGSGYYIAPETLLRKDVSRDEELGKDVYAFGFMLFEIIHVTLNAFKGYKVDEEFYRRISTDPFFRPVILFPASCDWLSELIKRCFHFEVKKRPTFPDINKEFEIHKHSFENDVSLIRKTHLKMRGSRVHKTRSLKISSREELERLSKEIEMEEDENRISYRSDSDRFSSQELSLINLNEFKKKHDEECKFKGGEIRICCNCSMFLCTKCIMFSCDFCKFDLCSECFKKGKLKDEKRQMCFRCHKKLLKAYSE